MFLHCLAQLGLKLPNSLLGSVAIHQGLIQGLQEPLIVVLKGSLLIDGLTRLLESILL